MSKKDIAIIGMSGKFSGSRNIREFWKNIRAGKELVHFYSEEELLDKGMDSALLKDDTYIKIGSRIDSKNSFDAAFFGYTKEEAGLMDPQIRLFHEHTWKALDDAGYNPYDYKDKIGLFAGASENTNWMAYSLLERMKADVDPFFANIIANKSFISTLVAYKLNLRGPACYVDTACSTSLVAVHMACRSLLMRECSMALAGAVSIKTNNTIGYKYQEGMINSRDGHCRTFDEKASGTTAGEGIGIVVLKRLEDAVNDKDHIYAVIKATAVNNDGNRKVGYTAPSTVGQAECIMMAHKFAGIAPEQVSYLEAHGTATRLGDPVEVAALNYAFGKNKDKHCAIGSVKSNLGHLDSAAGMAGLIKTALAMKFGEIPPSLHFNKPNPEIDFADGPFYVNTALRKWERKDNEPLRAGVSSFGIGGTNSHLVLEEAPPVQEPAPAGRRYNLLTLSAKTKTSLADYIEEVKAYLSDTNSSINNIAYTLQKRRKHYKYRHFLVHEQNGAESRCHDGKSGELETAAPPAVVFMFSGQGSQYVNMGKDLYQAEPAFRALLDDGLQKLEALTGEDYRSILFNDAAASQDNKINNTAYAQPLLFIFEYALAKLLMGWGIKPDCMVGHSIGELVAACVSEVFTFDDGLRIVLERARLMSSVESGAMLALPLAQEEVRPLLDSNINIAAVNAPAYCVVSGTHEEIGALSSSLEAKGVAFTKLKTSHAFHSAMMDPIREDFKKMVAGVPLSMPKIPFYSNISGKLIGNEALSAQYWSDHIRATVLFSDAVSELAQKGKTVFMEIGPGTALKSFCQQVDKAFKGKNLAINTIRHPKEAFNDQELLTDRLGMLWLQGVAVNWDEVYGSGERRIVPVPAYTFDKSFFTTDINAFQLIHQELGAPTAAGGKKDLSEWFYLPTWERSFGTAAAAWEGKNYLLFSDNSAACSALINQLITTGNQVVIVNKGKQFEAQPNNTITINEESEGDIISLREWMKAQDFEFDQVVYMWSCISQSANDKLDAHFRFLLSLHSNLQFQDIKTPRKLVLVTSGLQQVLGTEPQNNLGAALALGYCKVLSQEAPSFFSCCIDIAADDDPQQVAQQLYNETRYNATDRVLALRNGLRWTGKFTPHTIGATPGNTIREKGTYLITGGLGQLGVCLAEHLLSVYEANVILLGRTQLTTGSGDKLKTLNRLKELPGVVEYYAADISNDESLAACREQVLAQFGAIHGIIHLAGFTDPRSNKPIEYIGQPEMDHHFNPKIKGLLNIVRTFENDHPDFYWLSSSISTVLGGLTFAAYAAANSFMDFFAQQLSAKGINIITVNLDGLSLKQEGADASVINRPEMPEVFERSLQLPGAAQVVVSVSDLQERINRYVNTPAAQPEKKEAGTAVQATLDRPELSTAYKAPETEIEKKLAALWTGFFGFEKIGVLDNFFDLGGDSLKAMTLAKKIHREFNVEMSIEIFFKTPNIKSFAEEIEIMNSIRSIKEVSSHEGKTERKEKKEMII